MSNDSSRPQGLTFPAGETRAADLGNSLDQRPSEVVITIISSNVKIQNCSPETVESGENSDLEMDSVCRICLTNSDSVSSPSLALSTKNDLIQLGCKCKGEIGLIHVHCAQDWFRTKGNSCCEICGDPVKNIDECHIILEDYSEGTSTGTQATETTRSEGNASTNTSVITTYNEIYACLIEFIIWIIVLVIGGILVWHGSTNSG